MKIFKLSVALLLPLVLFSVVGCDGAPKAKETPPEKDMALPSNMPSTDTGYDKK